MNQAEETTEKLGLGNRRGHCVHPNRWFPLGVGAAGRKASRLPEFLRGSAPGDLEELPHVIRADSHLLRRLAGAGQLRAVEMKTASYRDVTPD